MACDPNHLHHITQDSLSRKYLVSSFLGGMLEFFEFTVFGFLSPVLIPLFFPQQYQSYTNFFFIFAISFMARPFGGMIFGYLGDKLGRKVSLNLSLLTMASSTFLIGCLPTIDRVGMMSTVALIVLRILQGISAGGEFPGGILFSIEHSPKRSRAFVSSLVGTGSMFGLLLGNLASQLVISSENASIYWRIPFLGSLLISGVCYYIRNKLKESETFINSAQQETRSFNLRDCSGAILKGVLLSSIGGMLCYFNTFYLSSCVGLPKYSIIATLLLIVFPPSCAWLADRYIGINGSILKSLMLMSILLPTMLILEPLMGTSATIVVYIIFLITASFFLGPMHAAILGGFQTRMRYRGYAITYNLGMGVAGGSTPFIVSLSHDLTGSYLFFVLLFFTVCLCSIMIFHKQIKEDDLGYI